jgi:hypothetical protein
VIQAVINIKVVDRSDTDQSATGVAEITIVQDLSRDPRSALQQLGAAVTQAMVKIKAMMEAS